MDYYSDLRQQIARKVVELTVINEKIFNSHQDIAEGIKKAAILMSEIKELRDELNRLTP